MDVTSGGIGELIYNCIGLGGGNYFMRMCLNCRLCTNLTYCTDCYSTKDCFGCTGLRNKRFCVFNTQYDEDTYRSLVASITAHMHATGEWGDFFPVTLSPFAFNEGGNSEEHPLSKEEVLRRGWDWQVKEDAELSGTPTKEWPEDIAVTPDNVIAQVYTCSGSGKLFKIIPQELEFYRTMKIPLPHEHPDVRMARRRSILTPYALFERPCKMCGKLIDTSYPSARTENIYCEDCYLKAVY